MLTLDELTERVMDEVPPVGATPSITQYQRTVAAALADLSRRAPMRKVVQIMVVAGVSMYPLPADFVRAIRLPGSPGAGGVIVGADGMLYPTGEGLAETWAVTGATLTVSPTPRYTMARELVYAAGYVADGEGVYPDLSEGIAEIALLKAQARAWELIAATAPMTTPAAQGVAVKRVTSATGAAVEYVTGEALAQTHRATAARLLADYEAALTAHIGAVGM